MIIRQFCTPSKGINLLTKNTNTLWRAISPQCLYPNMCVATILPANMSSAKLYPILTQHVYMPKDINPIRTPERLYKYLQTTSQKALKVMPSVKYGLQGMKIKIMNIIRFPDVLCLVEGIASLRGDLVVKPTSGLNPLALSVSDKSGKITLAGALQAKNDFLNSLIIKKYVPEGKPILSIGSSLTDKILMTSTSIQLALEGNSQKITAVFTPEYNEIKTRFGLTLEIQMGCEFSGKVTYYPSHTDLTKQASMTHNINTGLLIGGAVIGATIFCVFAPEALAVVAGASLLFARY